MKQKPKTILFLLLSVLVSTGAYANGATAGTNGNSENGVSQAKTDITVKGRVLDVKGEPVPGASVVVRGTNIGTVTDVDGYFTLPKVNSGAQVDVTSLGYATATIIANSSQSQNVILQEDTELLEEVLVVGYGTQRKQEITGSVVSVKQGDFNEGPTSNAFQMLIGKAAGVNVSQTSSAPGAASKIQIRGAGSINSSNDALVVVDGLPGVDPSSILPEDIESIEILKDASAAAIYGTRAANGVVLITTKGGAKGAPKVEFRAEGGVQTVAKKLDLLNGEQYMRTLNAIRIEGGGEPIYTDAQISAVGAGTDWQDEIFRSAPVQNYSLSLSGAGDKHDYYVGLGFTDQKGLVKRSGMTSYNVRTNVNVNPTDFLRFKLNLNYTRKEIDSTPHSFSTNEAAGPIGSAVLFDPTLPGGINPETGRYWQNDFIALDNPSALVEGTTPTTQSNNVYGSFTMEIEPLKDLVATARVGATVYNYADMSYTSRITKNGLAQGGIASQTRGESSQWMAEFLLTYKKTFANAHHTKFLLGATFEQQLSHSVSASARNFLSDATGVNKMGSGDSINGDDVSSTKSRNRLNGFLGRINYDYKDKYLLTASFRYDGTSRFADSHKYAFFPSIAAAWRISEENFLKNSRVVNDLKLRVGYGELGNEGIGNYQTIETLSAGGKAVFGNDLIQGLVQSRLVNPNLRWETTAETNVGIDFGFLKSRIHGSLDFFIRDTRDQLFDKPMPGVVGFSTMKVNMGTVRNLGLDLSINSVNFDREKFGWTTQLNLSFLENKVMSLPPFISELITGSIASFISNYQITRVGNAMYSYYGYEVAGIFQTTDDIEHSAQPNAKPGYIKYKDQDGNGSIGPEDRVILGKPFPDCTLGFTNDFRLGNFKLSIFLQGVFGINTLDAQTVETLYPANEYRNRMAEYYLNRWTPENPSTKYPSGVGYANYGGQYQINSLTVVDASFLRIKNIHLEYNIPFKKNRIISGASVYAAVDNVYTFTNYKGFDPDASSSGSSSVSKVNYNNYPLARTYRAGLNLKF
ncbi:MAG: TonB-dependent receptor [Bacteroidales bacterium]|nr:TonB-dependent receptor [Bacteroidales bacterium]